MKKHIPSAGASLLPLYITAFCSGACKYNSIVTVGNSTDYETASPHSAPLDEQRLIAVAFDPSRVYTKEYRNYVNLQII